MRQFLPKNAFFFALLAVGALVACNKDAAEDKDATRDEAAPAYWTVKYGQKLNWNDGKIGSTTAIGKSFAIFTELSRFDKDTKNIRVTIKMSGQSVRGEVGLQLQGDSKGSFAKAFVHIGACNGGEGRKGLLSHMVTPNNLKNSTAYKDILQEEGVFDTQQVIADNAKSEKINELRPLEPNNYFMTTNKPTREQLEHKDMVMAAQAKAVHGYLEPILKATECTVTLQGLDEKDEPLGDAITAVPTGMILPY